MPWRSDPSPYKVWVSEIMLQQTQVVTVIPYFDRFIRAFPDPQALAAAELEDVLRLWEGLGYYSRARNLHRAARLVVSSHGGRPPTTAAELRLLPGIGPYTAAAIASIAFGEPVPAVDGNVLRVCSRLWGISRPIRERPVAAGIAARLVPLIGSVNPSHFNQAMMETGALICRPRQPLCGQCLLSKHCVAYRCGRTDALPAISHKPKLPRRILAAAVVWKGGRVLMVRRPETGFLGGLWEFPGARRAAAESLRDTARRAVREQAGTEVRVGEPLTVVKHAYSHFRITLTAFRCDWERGAIRPKRDTALRWVNPSELSDYPISRAHRRIAESLGGQVTQRGAARGRARRAARDDGDGARKARAS